MFWRICNPPEHEYRDLQSRQTNIITLQMLIFNTGGLQIRQNKRVNFLFNFKYI